MSSCPPPLPSLHLLKYFSSPGQRRGGGNCTGGRPLWLPQVRRRARRREVPKQHRRGNSRVSILRIWELSRLGFDQLSILINWAFWLIENFDQLRIEEIGIWLIGNWNKVERRLVGKPEEKNLILFFLKIQNGRTIPGNRIKVAKWRIGFYIEWNDVVTLHHT